MSARLWLAGVVLSAVPVLIADREAIRPGPSGAAPRQVAPVQPGIPQDGATSTLDDQVDLSLTVYNSSLALVRDVRQIRIAGGESELHFMDIAATVNSGDGPLPIADRAGTCGRARTELRVRPAGS